MNIRQQQSSLHPVHDLYLICTLGLTLIYYLDPFVCEILPIATLKHVHQWKVGNKFTTRMSQTAIECECESVKKKRQ